MHIKEIISHIEKIAPGSLQESFDNSGLLTGSLEKKVSSALITLDVTEKVIEEAIEKKCDMIIAHHPLIFKPLKQITGKDETERILIQAIKHDIAIFAAHTNLDISAQGVNTELGKLLGLQKISPLDQRKNLLKLSTYIPESTDNKINYPDIVREALFNAGAGSLGNYDSCSFNAPGNGTYRPGENSTPFAGKTGELHQQNEIKIEVVFPDHKKGDIIQALTANHPYEQPAYNITLLENPHPFHGLGMVGELEKSITEKAFLDLVKSKVNCQNIRHSPFLDKKIKKIAVCGGAGAGLIQKAAQKGADAFLTSDVKYHQFFEASDHLFLVDGGHYETEFHTIDLIFNLLRNKMPNFAVRKTEINTNPVNYY